MSTSNTDAYNLASATGGSFINEDVMQKIYDISRVPLPFSDRIGRETSSNQFKEWTVDALSTPDLTNAEIDGADASGNDSVVGTRMGNRHQIFSKVIQLSKRAQAVDSIGGLGGLNYQLRRRQQEIYRDLEAVMLNNQASVDGTDSVAGKLGGLPSWIATAHTNGSAGGFNTTTKLTVARTTTTRSALTETKLRDTHQTIYNNGGDPSIVMSVPAVIRKISEYLYSSSARVASMMSDLGQNANGVKAYGSVKWFESDFGMLEMVPNRIQQLHLDSGGVNSCADVFVLDPSMLAISFLSRVQVINLAQTGLSDRRQMFCDATLMVMNEKAQGIIGDINHTADMTA